MSLGEDLSGSRRLGAADMGRQELFATLASAVLLLSIFGIVLSVLLFSRSLS